MKILCVFSGQGHKEPGLFNAFDKESYQHWVAPWAELLGMELTNPELPLHDYHHAPMLIGAYQWCWFHLIQPLLSFHQVDLAGYSLGEVLAYLVSIKATPQEAYDVLKCRTQLMTTIIKDNESYDLLSLSGHYIPNELETWCNQQHCFIAIIQSSDHLILGGKIQDLQALLRQLMPYHLKATFLKIGVPSHTPFYNSIKGKLYPYLISMGESALHYSLWNPLKLQKIVLKEEEAQLLDAELYTPLAWQQLSALIKEYHYDLIIDLGPGTTMSRFLSFTDTPLCSLSLYKSTKGLLNALSNLLE